MDTVDCQIESCEPTRKETSPPPVVILCTKVEVAQKDGGFRAGDDQDDEDKKQEPIHVVDLTGPDAVEDKEKLNEDTSEWEDTTHDDARDGLSVD